MTKAPVRLATAIADGFTVYGTCDWGHCQNTTFGIRWDPVLREYLSVCEKCYKAPFAP